MIQQKSNNKKYTNYKNKEKETKDNIVSSRHVKN